MLPDTAKRKKKALRILLISVAMVGVQSRVLLAAHPLITDDTETLGKGRYQVEINAEYGYDANNGVIQHTTPAASTLTYGVSDMVDVSIGVPYLWTNTRNSGSTISLNGFGDVAVAAKWRFYERGGLSLALKPVITLPTGSEDMQLGTGRMTYSLFFITTREVGLWAFDLNLGYITNENKIGQRVPIWHASIAAEVKVGKSLTLAANTGIQRNTEKDSHTDPVFILGGLIYSITKNVDIDAGYKYGLTRAEVDHTVLAGVTLHF